jgi:dTDP-4-dehydrorhamnose reductase
MRLLVTGAAGMLGTDVCSAATAAGHEVLAPVLAELDVTDSAAVRAVIGRDRPDAIVNCAAWTDVDGAEEAEELALAVNGDGAANVASAAADAGAHVIHVSTDYVFDGRKREPYVESDPVGPLSAYGRSKLAGERGVAAQAPGSHTIVRSSWLFGTAGSSFPKTILRLADARETLTVVDDQVGSPTFTGHLAPALVSLAVARPTGVLHVAASGSCSWYELAQEVVASAGLECDVQPGSTADLGRPAPRPAYSVLASERPEAPQLPRWREGLAEFMATGVRVN